MNSFVFVLTVCLFHLRNVLNDLTSSIFNASETKWVKRKKGQIFRSRSFSQWWLSCTFPRRDLRAMYLLIFRLQDTPDDSLAGAGKINADHQHVWILAERFDSTLGYHVRPEALFPPKNLVLFSRSDRWSLESSIGCKSLSCWFGRSGKIKLKEIYKWSCQMFLLWRCLL